MVRTGRSIAALCPGTRARSATAALTSTYSPRQLRRHPRRPGPHHAEPGEEIAAAVAGTARKALADAETECPDRKPKAIGSAVPSGPQSHQVMEVAVADVLAERVHDAPRVVTRAFDVHGHPVPAELQVAYAVPFAEMPRGLREVRVRLEPEPASVPDRAEHDPLDE